MREKIIGKQFDEERALYYLQHTDVEDCIFAGPADGESVLKEARDVGVKNCTFSLRYPLWHVQGFRMENSTMDELTRAAIWYACDGEIKNSTLGGIKESGNAATSALPDAISFPRNSAGSPAILP